MLVGRGTERAALERRLAQARRGSGKAVLLLGEPGVGKTALINELCGKASGVTALRSAGVASEVNLGFSALSDLVRPVLALLDRVPEAQAFALRSALALGARGVGPPDRFAAFAGVLSLFAAAAERVPLLIAVDDAHWLDGESAGALAFCARRVDTERVLLLVSARSQERLGFETGPFEVVRVGGLGPAASAALLAAVSGVEVDARVATRLQAATAGNPLALRELGSLLTVAQLTGRAPLDEPLPVSAGIERLFARQVSAQPAAVQQALLLAAASTSDRVGELERALRALGSSLGVLEAAEAGGLIAFVDGRVEFKHPLLRAVVYRGAAASARRAAHRVLAEVAGGADAGLRRAWHRASATVGTDESVACELERAGMELAARTGYAAAASALERAAALSERDQERGRRLVEAGRTAQLAGLFDQAREAVKAALECSKDPSLLADCAEARARIELYAGDVSEAHRLLLEAAERIAPSDPVREVGYLLDAVLPLFNAGDVFRAVEIAQRAYRRSAALGGETALLARKVLGGALVLHGQAPVGYKMALDRLETEQREPETITDRLLGQWGVLISIWVEDYERARAIINAVLPLLRASGALSPLPFTLTLESELEFRAGNWKLAVADASDAVSIAQEVGQRGTFAYSLVTLGRVEAAIGGEQSCYEHLDTATRVADECRAGSIHTYAGAALGLLEVGLSRPERAREHLEPLDELTRRQGLAEPGTVCWQPDYAECLIRLDELDAARRALARFEREATAVNRIWALAAVARCRGLMAAEDEFEAHFARALELHALTPTPFELARTELCLGERLRRANRRADARDPLVRAKERFSRLGAEPWVAKAEQELAAMGARSARPREPHGELPLQDLLSHQELQVARAVAEGKSNKEVAASLFLSPKTIEFHLGQIYRKLGIRSRTQLSRKLDERGG